MKTLLLLSGGIDSPVAGHLLKKKGFPLEAIHFSLEPYTDSEPEDKSRALAKKLGLPFHVMSISREVKQIVDKCDRRFYFILMKRDMFRKAEALARKLSCKALATGESLGQVSSQTLENLRAIDSSVSIPVLRPLIAMDKQEIVSIAEKIGTFETSKGKEACDVLGPEHPATKATLDQVLEQEKLLNQT